MRAPLLVLLGAYALSIGGLVLIPGLDDKGNLWYFDFFHAFYFVSFMGSTIGFGEIPYPFSGGQRLWTTISLYICVISWLYAIGSILAIVQDPAFRRVVREQRFTRRVRRLTSPFYLVCGYGETGSLLVSALHRRNIQSVVIDIDSERINRLELEDFNFDIPCLSCDAREVKHLQEAGIEHPCCIGVIALTDNEDVNVKIAITSKLLRPQLKVICRAENRSTAANLASFNTDHIIDPFTIFADHLAMALRAPSVHLLYKWLISVPNLPLPTAIRPPRGAWVVCGFGRFGRAVHRYLGFEGIDLKVIEPDIDQAPDGAIIGRGTEAVTLREAGIEKAVGIVAGTDIDINNLSIVMTAREQNPDLFLVARQNRRSNDPIFQAADLDLIMQASRIIVWRILPLLMTPLLGRFLRNARHHNEEWANGVLGRLRAICATSTPLTWALEITTAQAPAVVQALQVGYSVKLDTLLREPRDRECELPCVALLLVRGDEQIELPTPEQRLRYGDTLLLSAPPEVAERMQWNLFNYNAINYILTGETRPDGYIWRWLARRRALRNDTPAPSDSSAEL